MNVESLLVYGINLGCGEDEGYREEWDEWDWIQKNVAEWGLDYSIGGDLSGYYTYLVIHTKDFKIYADWEPRQFQLADVATSVEQQFLLKQFVEANDLDPARIGWYLVPRYS